jgi:predicted amidohydrolase YtcJ
MRYGPILPLLAFVAASPLAAQSPPSGVRADLVVYGRVWTGDVARPRASAVAVVGDRVAAVGDSADIARWVGPDTRVIQNGTGLIAPGFNDDHTHFLTGGFQLTRVDLRDADSPAEFTRRIEAYAATLKPGEWILGGDWDDQRWPGTPLPTREWIDSVTPENPVFVNRLDGHMAVANSLALRLAGLSDASSAPPGGTMVRDSDGHLTGLLKDNAQDAVARAIPDPSPEQADSALARAMEWAVRHGLTAVSAVSVSPLELAAMQRAHDRGSMLIRITAYPMLHRWKWIADYRDEHPGDAWLRVAGGKAFVDGSLGSTTALFFEPYDDAPGNTGLMVTPEDSLRAWIGAADSAGLQVAIHAIGDRANALLLDIFDSVAVAHGPGDRRFRIEHAQHLRPEDIPRFARLGVIASMQPYHAIDDGRWAERRIGPDRIKTTYAFRSLLDAGAHVAFGSDWTVAPLDPIAGIYAAVTRRTLDGKNPDGWVPEQKISLEEALRSYTYENAYEVHAEGERGVLRPGMLADLVLLDRDLFELRPEALDSARVRATVVGGKVMYEAEEP